MNWVGTTVARRLKLSRATLYSVPCSMARLAVLRGSSTTWFQTSRYCRAKVEFNSINWVRHGSSMTFETGLRRSRISVIMKFPPLSDLLNKAVKGLEQLPWGVSYGIFSGPGLLDNILKLPAVRSGYQRTQTCGVWNVCEFCGSYDGLVARRWRLIAIFNRFPWSKGLLAREEEVWFK